MGELFIYNLRCKLKTKVERKLEFLLFGCCFSTLIPLIMIPLGLVISFFNIGFNLYNIAMSIMYVALTVYLYPHVTKKANQLDQQIQKKQEEKLQWLKEHVKDDNFYRLELIHLLHEGIKDVGDVEKATTALEKKEIGQKMFDMLHYHVTHENSWNKSFHYFLTEANDYNNDTIEDLEKKLQDNMNQYLDTYMEEKLSPSMQKILAQKVNQNQKNHLSLGL